MSPQTSPVAQSETSSASEPQPPRGQTGSDPAAPVTNTPQANTPQVTNAGPPGSSAPVAGANPNSQTGNPLLIPDSALNNGSTRFLEGSWSAGAGIQDAATGKPVRLDYDFSQGNGQGRVTVKRGDGVQCTGAVGAQMQGRTVQINDRGTAKCTDGSTMALPKVTCTPGAGNQAACQGQYDNGTSFPVSMRHAPK